MYVCVCAKPNPQKKLTTFGSVSSTGKTRKNGISRVCVSAHSLPPGAAYFSASATAAATVTGHVTFIFSSTLANGETSESYCATQTRRRGRGRRRQHFKSSTINNCCQRFTGSLAGCVCCQRLEKCNLPTQWEGLNCVKCLVLVSFSSFRRRRVTWDNACLTCVLLPLGVCGAGGGEGLFRL